MKHIHQFTLATTRGPERKVAIDLVCISSIAELPDDEIDKATISILLKSGDEFRSTASYIDSVEVWTSSLRGLSNA